MAITTAVVPTLAGDIARGVRQTEYNRRGSQWYKSEAIAFNGDTTNAAFSLPGDCLIIGGFVDVTAAYDASGTSTAATATITVPNDSGGTETLYDAANVGLQATGLHPATLAVAMPSSGGDVTVLLDPATSTVGSFVVYIEVVQMDSLL